MEKKIPVGKIDFLDTNGEVGETCYYYTEEEFLKSVKHENYYGAPTKTRRYDMNIIEDLWFGNISPWERPFKKDSPYAELLALVVRHQEDLLSRMNEEEKEIFEKYCDCASEMHDLTEREAFVKGFTLGCRIIIEVMTRPEDFESKDS